MSNLPSALSPENYEALNAFVESFDSGYDLMKMQASFWDRLVIIDGATLALSLTAATAFKNSHSPPHDGGAGYFLAAWKLLIESALLGLASQWILTMSFDRLSGAQVSFRTAILMARSHPPETAADDLAARGKSLLKTVRHAQVLSRISYAIGGAAGLLCIVGFFWLYQYASVNLR